jgi:hypothetical protein
MEPRPEDAANDEDRNHSAPLEELIPNPRTRRSDRWGLFRSVAQDGEGTDRRRTRQRKGGGHKGHVRVERGRDDGRIGRPMLCGRYVTMFMVMTRGAARQCLRVACARG